jgi:hypothetical protein
MKPTGIVCSEAERTIIPRNMHTTIFGGVIAAVRGAGVSVITVRRAASYTGSQDTLIFVGGRAGVSIIT